MHCFSTLQTIRQLCFIYSLNFLINTKLFLKYSYAYSRTYDNWPILFCILNWAKDSLPLTTNLISCFRLPLIFIGKSTQIAFGDVINTRSLQSDLHCYNSSVKLLCFIVILLCWLYQTYLLLEFLIFPFISPYSFSTLFTKKSSWYLNQSNLSKLRILRYLT